MINEISKEFSRLNRGLLADKRRQAGTLAAIINSRAHEVIAKMIIMVNSILLSFVFDIFVIILVI
jgi:hypothetical protein